LLYRFAHTDTLNSYACAFTFTGYDEEFAKTSIQIQTSISMAFTIAAVVLVLSRNNSTTIPSNRDIWRTITTGVVALTAGK